VRANVRKVLAFRRAFLLKEHGVVVEKSNIIEPQPSVEEGMAKKLNIGICLTSRICEGG
jgi:hypothetical protein